jgi:hypothetical protein
MVITNLATRLGSGFKLTRYTVTYADLQGIGTGASPQTLALFTLPIQDMIIGVRVVNVKNFTSSGAIGALTSLTVSLGKTGSVTYITAAYNIFAASSDTTVQETSLFIHGQLSALPVLLNFVYGGGGDTLANANAGQFDVDVATWGLTTDTTTIP